MGRLLVKQPDGEEKDVEVSSSSSVRAVKELLSKGSACSADACQLVFKGRVLSDSSKLSDTDVEDQSTLYLAHSMRGGMIIPVRCFTCGKVVGNKWVKFLRLLQADLSA